MIQQIFRQIWHKRHAYAWIFVELIMVTYFAWEFIDPVFVLISNRAIPAGLDTKHLFRLSLIPNEKKDQPMFTAVLNEDDEMSLRDEDLVSDAAERAFNHISQYPGVETALIIKSGTDPWYSYQPATITFDTVKVRNVRMQNYVPGDKFFALTRIRDAYSKEILPNDTIPRNSAFLSEDLAYRLTDRPKDLIGKQVYTQIGSDTVYMQVYGIMNAIKWDNLSYQPKPIAFLYQSVRHALQGPVNVMFRINGNLSDKVFAERFKKDMSKELDRMGFYMSDFESIDRMLYDRDVLTGAPDKLRLHIGMTTFFLFCVFLGIASTFWLRGRSRRGEIGVRMALGSSRQGILKIFLTEAWLLTTIAWLIGIFIVFQRVYSQGFAEAPAIPNDMYIQNRFVPHFLIVSGIVYVLMMLMALLGTYIPARQAAQTEPVDALRDDN